MFDTMTVTKVGGAFCGALLVYLLAAFAGEMIYSPGGDHDATGEEHAKAYVIDTGADEEDGHEEESADAPAASGDLLADADPDKGAKAFAKCKACHKLDAGKNAVGPHLFGIVGRPIAAVDGYKYSSALAEVGGDWTPEALNAWLEDPRAFAKGTKMTAKTKKPEDRINLIAYLQTIGG